MAQDPGAGGLLVVELDGERAGAMAWQIVRNGGQPDRPISGLAVHPRFRGRRLGDEAARLLQRHLLLDRGLHRLELEIYGFNERAQRHAERAGFIREGVKRKAYARDGGWEDGVLYALVAEDLDYAEVGGEQLAGLEAGPAGAGGCRRSRPRRES